LSASILPFLSIIPSHTCQNTLSLPDALPILTSEGLIQAAMVRVADRLSPAVVAAVTLPDTPSKLRAWPNLPAAQAVPPSRLPALPLPEESLARLPAPSSNM